uniref:Uncharacterized protein n=1 Tax=Ananas comosus var. bracteatus TaxID=296719 RepID=A0A6V7PX52_ANACO|nr:unnamed protein product [Ananas comosus var. bracteatus]
MPDSLMVERKEEIDDKALTTIQLYLSDEILREILDEKITVGLRLKLESLYMTKSLTNKLYLKQHLFMLRMAEENTNTEAEASVAARESDGNDIIFTVTDKTRRQDEWLIDSACSFHICTHKEWFLTYTPVQGGDVLMGNHSKCTVIGIDTVRWHKTLKKKVNFPHIIKLFLVPVLQSEKGRNSWSGRYKYKARLVAKGYSQVESVDFNDIFSPVVKHTSIRVFLSLVAMNNLYLEKLDVKTSFLHEKLEEQIYMKQPEGFIAEGKEDHVCLLNKSLYGLK